MMLIALALAAAETPVPPDPCPVFERLVAAAGETPAFSSIRRALAGGEAVVPGFEPGDCEVAGGAFRCSNWGMGSHGFPDWREPVSCPGLTALPRPRQHFRRAFAFAAPGGLRIVYGVHCFQCAGPATAYFRIGRGDQEGREE